MRYKILDGISDAFNIATHNLFIYTMSTFTKPALNIRADSLVPPLKALLLMTKQITADSGHYLIMVSRVALCSRVTLWSKEYLSANHDPRSASVLVAISFVQVIVRAPKPTSMVISQRESSILLRVP